MEFQDKRVLVTGAARGLGEAIVSQFVGLGAKVFALDKEENLLSALKSKYPSVTTLTVDLRDWEKTRKAVEEIAPIHHLINNAGMTVPHSLSQVDEQTIDLFMDVNFKSMINVSQAMLKGVVEHKVTGGTIVNISSLFASKAHRGQSIYCCSKAAVTMLTKCLALEFAPHNIRVNCIRPGLMLTGLGEDPQAMQALSEVAMQKQLIKQKLTTGDSADLVIFLSSSKSKMITGQDVVIDGGILTN